MKTYIPNLVVKATTIKRQDATELYTMSTKPLQDRSL